MEQDRIQSTKQVELLVELVGDRISIEPLGGAGTAAPSTLIIDKSFRGSIYYSPKPFSATYAQLTAATSSAAPVNII